MWFKKTKKPEVEDDGYKELKAFSEKTGGKFNYLGIEMFTVRVVKEFWGFDTFVPVLRAEYVNKKGELMDKNFYPRDLERLIKENNL